MMHVALAHPHESLDDKLYWWNLARRKLSFGRCDGRLLPVTWPANDEKSGDKWILFVVLHYCDKHQL